MHLPPGKGDFYVSLIAFVLSNHYWATRVCPHTPCNTSDSHLLLPWPDRKSYTWELLQPDVHCPNAVSSMHDDAAGTAPSVFLFCKGWRNGGGVQGCGGRHWLCCMQRVVHTAPSPTELFKSWWDSQSMSQRKGVALPLLACSGHLPCHDQKESKANFPGLSTGCLPQVLQALALWRSETEGEVCSIPASQRIQDCRRCWGRGWQRKQCQKAVGKRYLPSHVTSAIQSAAAVKLDCAKGPDGRAGAPAAAIEWQEEELRQQSSQQPSLHCSHPPGFWQPTAGTFRATGCIQTIVLSNIIMMTKIIIKPPNLRLHLLSSKRWSTHSRMKTRSNFTHHKAMV